MDFHNEERARKRRCTGQRRETQALRSVPPHPSKGGARGYPVAFRIAEINNHHHGYPTTASTSSLYRWEHQRVLPYRMTGNRENTQIVGFEMFLLLQHVFVFPEAEDDEIAAFIFNGTGRLYDRSQISRRKAELKISRKRLSTEAHQAYT